MSSMNASQQSKPLEIELTILSAKHLHNVNWRNGNIKPYVVFRLDSDRHLSTVDKDKSLIGTELLCVVRAVLKKIKRRVLVGDKVIVGAIDWVDKRGMIENVFQRKSEILDPPVANVDHLLVVFSVDQPKLEPFTLTRCLVEAESTGMPVTLALNKCELADEELKEKLRYEI